MQYYTDEHISNAIIAGLRRHGIDILSTVEASMRGASDIEHLEQARKLKRVIITQDSDFLRLHAQGIQHSGIVFIRHDKSIGEIISAILLIDDILTLKEIENNLQFL